MAFILDASAALPWCFKDEASQALNALLFRLTTGEPAVVPAHWAIEVGNALLMAIRRTRIPYEDVVEFLTDLTSLPIELDRTETNLIRVSILPLAEKHKLTLYDAAYLELALRLNLPLATLDRELRKAAKLESIPLIAI